MSIWDEMKKIPPRDLEIAGVLTAAKKSGYICKVCGNGTGKDGDGLSVKEYSWGYNYHCFGKCGRNYTAVDLISEYLGTTALVEIAEYAREKFKLDSDSFPSHEKKLSVPAVKQNSADVPKKDYSEFYQQAQKNLAEFLKDTGKLRGLTLKNLQEVKAGMATAAELAAVGENVPASVRCLILPYNKHRFLMRSISGSFTVKRGNTGGKKDRIYNPYAVDFESAVFAVEGELDSISIRAAGFPAVALGGAGQGDLLMKELEHVNKTKVRLIILFDNDGAGQENASKLLEKMKAKKYAAVNFILSPKNGYDANEYLQKDFDGLKARLTEIYNQANFEFEQMEREEMKTAGIESFASADIESLSKQLQAKVLKWGFEKLDAKLPMLPGCYLLGALPGMGKTTFALNVCSNICGQGEKVLYVSFEQKLEQLATKDLVHYWFLKERGKTARAEFVPTATQIMLGKYNELEKYNHFFGVKDMQEIHAELRAKRENLYFLQGQRETAQDLISKIQTAVNCGVKFVVIDYLQLIKGADNSKPMREQIDSTIRELQMFQQKNDLVILFLSSFNRENYRNYACLESFKESGGLEFTADAILALQFEFSSGESRMNTETFQQKKQRYPRDIELICLKNRYGLDFTDRFTYVSARETFIEKSTESKATTDEEIDVE